MKVQSVLQILKRKYVGKSFKFYHNIDSDGSWISITQHKQYKRDFSISVDIVVRDVIFITQGLHNNKEYYLKIIYNNQKHLILLELE